MIYCVDREAVTVIVIALGRRPEGDRADIYELARRLIRLRLIE